MGGLAIQRQLFGLLRHWPWLHYPREILLILSALRRVRLNSPSRFNSVHRKLKDNRDRRRSSAIGPDGPHQGSRLTLEKIEKRSCDCAPRIWDLAPRGNDLLADELVRFFAALRSVKAAILTDQP